MPAKKRRRKATSKAKTKAATPTPDNPVVVEDEVEDDASSKSIEHIFEVVPIQTKLSGIKIREPEDDILSSSDKKGKRILEDEQEFYVRNIRAQKLDVSFINLRQADMVAHLIKLIAIFLVKVTWITWILWMLMLMVEVFSNSPNFCL